MVFRAVREIRLVSTPDFFVEFLKDVEINICLIVRNFKDATATINIRLSSEIVSARLMTLKTTTTDRQGITNAIFNFILNKFLRLYVVPRLNGKS